MVAADAHGQWFGGFAQNGYHASTVAEGEGNAISAVTCSKGQFLIDKSQPRINNAQADAMVMQNRKQLASDYHRRLRLERAEFSAGSGYLDHQQHLKIFLFFCKALRITDCHLLGE